MPFPRPRVRIRPSATIVSPRSMNSSTARSQVSKFSSSAASHSDAPSCPRNGSPLNASPIAVRISTSGSNSSSGGLRSPAFQRAKAARMSSTLGLSVTLPRWVERLERFVAISEDAESYHLAVVARDFGVDLDLGMGVVQRRLAVAGVPALDYALDGLDVRA